MVTDLVVVWTADELLVGGATLSSEGEGDPWLAAWQSFAGLRCRWGVAAWISAIRPTMSASKLVRQESMSGSWMIGEAIRLLLRLCFGTK